MAMLKVRMKGEDARRGKTRTASCVMAAGLLFAAGFLLQGCREEEQGRILLFDKGTYIGENVDGNKLAPATVEQLNKRAEKQWM